MADEEDRYWIGPATAPETYELIAPIDGGGEGEVWLARLPLSTGGFKRVAVKIQYGTGEADDVAWQRHGHLVKSVEHPGLVRVIDVFVGPRWHRRGGADETEAAETEADDTTAPAVSATCRYVVMSHVDGQTLSDWIAEHPDATVRERLKLLRGVAGALDELHSGRQTRLPVAHGDVKPSNIIIRPEGSGVLVDLGLARIADDHGRVGRSRPYAAPELAQTGATPDTDRFAFVYTVVHALTGQVPPTPAGGQSPDPAATRQVLLQALPDRPALAAAVAAAAAAFPAQRPQSLQLWLSSLIDTLSQTATQGGAVLADAVPQTTIPPSAWATSPPLPPRPSVPPHRDRRVSRRTLLACLVVVLLLAAGAAAYLSLGNSPTKGRAGPGPGPITSGAPQSCSHSSSGCPNPTTGDTTTESTPAPGPTAPQVTYLDTLVGTGSTPTERGLIVVNGRQLNHSVSYNVGVSAGSASETFDLPGRYTRLTATLGLVRPSLDGIVVEFRVEADGIQVVDQNVDATRTQAINITLSQPASQITLHSDYGEGQFGGCDAVWGDVTVSDPTTGS